MEVEDLSSADEFTSGGGVAYDEVVAFTPSSPDTPRAPTNLIQVIEVEPASEKKHRKSRKKADRHRTSQANDQNFVKLESEDDDHHSKVIHSQPILVKPKKSSQQHSEETQYEKGLEAFDESNARDDREHIPKTESRSRKSRNEERNHDLIEQPIHQDDSNLETKPKRRHKHKKKSKKSEKETKPVKPVWPGDLKGIFDIDGVTSDVVMNELGLTWANISMGLSTSKKKSKKKDDECNLHFENIIGLKIRRQRKGKQSDGEGVCQGLTIQTFERKENGKIKDKLLLFLNPSQDICLEWSARMQSVLNGFTSRPKKLLVFLQPFAGKKMSRSTYNKEILPLFEMAGITCEKIDVNHNQHIKHEMIHADLNKYDCIVCVGGDGTVSDVINSLLTRIQKENHVELALGFVAVKPKIPIGIIPTGTFNQICHSVQGVEDPVTSAIHIILSHKLPADICSIYLEEKFHTWAFNCHYGFFGSVLTFLPRFARLGERRLDAAIMKTLTKAKFKSYECDIQYIPFKHNDKKQMQSTEKCRQGCTYCLNDQSGINHNEPIMDEVQSLEPLDESGNSNTLADLSKKSPWKLLKDEFISVSVLSSAAMSDLAPQGMSPCSHLSDGSLQLIMVKATDKKEFLRYLKRHGNEKDQLNLPFIETVQCSEVRLHARYVDSWEHKDYSFNEILDEVKKSESKSKHGLHRADSIEVIDDLNDGMMDSDDDSIEHEVLEYIPVKMDETGSQKKSGSAKMRTKSSKSSSKLQQGYTEVAGGLQNLGFVNENVQEVDEENNKKIDRRLSNAEKKSKGSAGSKRTLHEKIAQDTNTVMHVTPKYRPSFIEQEHARRMKSKRKHDEKKKSKSEAKQRSIWNRDSIMEPNTDLHFRVHRGLVELCGEGVPLQYEPDDIKMGCLAIF